MTGHCPRPGWGGLDNKVLQGYYTEVNIRPRLRLECWQEKLQALWKGPRKFARIAPVPIRDSGRRQAQETSKVQTNPTGLTCLLSGRYARKARN